MRKIFTLILLAAATIGAYADEADYGFAVTIGYAQPMLRENLAHNFNFGNVADMDGRFNTFSPDWKGKTLNKGMKVGVLFDASIIKGFGTSVGLNYSFGFNTTKWTLLNSIYTTQVRTRSQIHQIEMPVDWQYKFAIATNTYVIIYTGPTIQLNIAGRHSIYSRDYQDLPKSEWKQCDVNPFSNEKVVDGGMEGFAIERYNVLWGVGAGFQYKQFFIRGGYDFGLINAYKQHTLNYSDAQVTNPSIRSRLDQWQIKLGVFLWHSRY